MGMFDTIYFDKEYVCPLCQGKIDSVQVKEFENLLEVFHVKDCVSHAEDIRIIKKKLFCDKCSKFTGKNIFIIISRGILLGTADTLEEGKKLLNDLNFEKLVICYHDLYQRFISEQKEKQSYRRFLEDVREWYSEKVYEKSEFDLTTIMFLQNSRLRNRRYEFGVRMIPLEQARGSGLVKELREKEEE